MKGAGRAGLHSLPLILDVPDMRSDLMRPRSCSIPEDNYASTSKSGRGVTRARESVTASAARRLDASTSFAWTQA
jgi:hypothetical protein